MASANRLASRLWPAWVYRQLVVGHKPAWATQCTKLSPDTVPDAGAGSSFINLDIGSCCVRSRG